MTEVRFYHLTRNRFEEALPQILGKALERDMRAVIYTAGGADHVETLNNHLWTFSDRIFLPHGSKKDGNPEHQPVWITDTFENPNKANLLVLSDGAQTDEFKGYDLGCYFFDGNNDIMVKQAREYWKQLLETDMELTYWQQKDNGAWDKKATSSDSQ